MLILFDLESLKGLLSVDYEVVGTANRASEEQTWIHFVDFLDECEGTFTLSSIQAQAVQCSYYFPYVCFMQLEKLTAQWKMCSCYWSRQGSSIGLWEATHCNLWWQICHCQHLFFGATSPYTVWIAICQVQRGHGHVIDGQWWIWWSVNENPNHLTLCELCSYPVIHGAFMHFHSQVSSSW